MNTSADPIKAEIAKIQPKFDLQSKSRELAELVKEITGIVDGIGGHVRNGGLEIQVHTLNSLLKINHRPTMEKRDSSEYPFELSANAGGVGYFTILTSNQWLQWAKDNQICTDCGKDFAEYMDYDQNVEKMYYGCRDCRNGEATGKAV